MAIAEYQPIQIAAGDCVDNDDIQDLLDNLKSLYASARENGSKITCQRINESVTYGRKNTITQNSNGTPVSPINTNEDIGCITIQSGAVPFGSDPDEKKILALQIVIDDDFVVTGNNDDSIVDVTNEIWVECDGDRVWSGTASEANFVSFECPRSSEILLCARTTFDITSASVVYDDSTMQICGGILCIERFDTETSMPSFFCPPCPLKPDAKPGREVLHLLYQNILALCNFFQDGGQTQSCLDFDFDDELTHPLITNVAGETTYLAIGEVTVCVRMRTEGTLSSADYAVTPLVGCDGEQSDCIGKRVSLSNEDESDLPNAACITIPVFVCGTCQPGQTISAGFLANEECNGVPDPFSTIGDNIEVTYVNQSYCLYAWEQVPIAALQGFQRPNPSCIDEDTFTNITDKMDLLESIACERTPINCFFDSDLSTVPDGDSKLLVPADPTPVPVPPGWPFNRKATLLVEFQFCANYANFNAPLSGYSIRGYLEVTCGGNVIKTIDAGDGQEFEFVIPDVDSFRICSPKFSRICCNLSCPVDQPIAIQPVITTPLPAGAVDIDVPIKCTQLGF